MSKFIKEWLKVSAETRQEGETPKADFSEASNPATDTKTDAPATAELPPPSDAAPATKTVETEHQTVTKASEAVKDTTEQAIDEAAKSTVSVEEDASQATDTETDKPAEAEVEPGEELVEPEEMESDEQVSPETPATPTEEVANEDIADASGQEVPADEPVVEIVDEPADEPTVTPIETLQEEIEEIQDDIDHFTDVAQSLEAYADILTQALANGGADDLTVQAIRVGLESLDESFGGENVVPALEAFGKTSSRQTATQVSLEKVGESLGKVIEAIRRAVAKLMEILRELWVQMTGGAARAKKRLGELKGRIEKLKDVAGPEKVELKSPARLMVDQTFVGNDPAAVKAIARIAEFMYNDYPAEVLDIVTFAAKTYSNAAKSLVNGPADQITKWGSFNDVIDGLDDRVYRLKIPDNKPVDKTEVPASIARYVVHPTASMTGRKIQMTRTEKVAGNYALIKYFNMDVGVVHGLSKHLVVEFRALEGQPTAGVVEYTLPSKADLLAMTRELEALLEKIAGASEAERKYREVSKMVNSTLNEIKKFENIEGGIAKLSSMATSLQQIMKILTRPVGQFNGYAVSACNAFMAVLEHNLRIHEAAETAETA